jgi:hypothetical protein
MTDITETTGSIAGVQASICLASISKEFLFYWFFLFAASTLCPKVCLDRTSYMNRYCVRSTGDEVAYTTHRARYTGGLVFD